jgi:UDP:flavonoid glycosyltransferase YjiC (YdhE family)
VANAVFRTVYPAAFALHALPFHRACAFYGVTPPGVDIRDVYTASDATAFADVAAFYETPGRPSEAPFFIGPLAWEPGGLHGLPAIPDGPPIVFVSLGSSGNASDWTRLVQALQGLPVRCILATGERGKVTDGPSQFIHQSEFISYAKACSAATLVVCNGGAPATYAALRAGCPVLGLAANLDQLLNMRVIERLHAGGRLAAADADSIATAIKSALIDETLVRGAREAARRIAEADSGPDPIQGWLARLTAKRQQADRS